MKSYRYELVVYKKQNSKEYGNVGVKVKRFIGNNKNELHERFERWFIKQGLDRVEIDLHIGEIQHIGY